MSLLLLIYNDQIGLKSHIFRAVVSYKLLGTHLLLLERIDPLIRRVNPIINMSVGIILQLRLKLMMEELLLS